MKEKSCINCDNSLIINDRDPYDWFCDDDLAVVCKLVKNDKQDLDSRHPSDHSQYKAVAVSIRPYCVEREAIVPEWCPKLNMGAV